MLLTVNQSCKWVVSCSSNQCVIRKCVFIEADSSLIGNYWYSLLAQEYPSSRTVCCFFLFSFKRQIEHCPINMRKNVLFRIIAKSHFHKAKQHRRHAGSNNILIIVTWGFVYLTQSTEIKHNMTILLHLRTYKWNYFRKI